MATYSIPSGDSISQSHDAEIAPPETRFDRRLAQILEHATEVFYQKGYDGASMRDLSRASGISLAGMYHYFHSKDPELRIRAFIFNHLGYFLANRKAMTVLSHEDEALNDDEFVAEIAALKREYYKICLALLEDYKAAKRLQFNSRTAVLSLFGMINWVYTWHSTRHDPGAVRIRHIKGVSRWPQPCNPKLEPKPW
jgi:AcrR family transcriptional regulator